ncbi:ABC transporter ATP-binding protein [Streptomyces carpinensis]|uniref:ATP-binding cassette domain-containing protein n=1 Tax=Streptomyces carpinensis TaxID=66369 RepID=A0ABV1W6G0_9ACTN|nr:ATP-binding cassette domain-containing protein [Streptomyces carpinensis]
MIAKGLTRRFGALTAVDHLDLEVRSQEVFGLLGANGAGKTTTIKMLITLLPPSHGTARVAGFDVTAQAAGVRRSIGYVPQMLSTDGSLTAWENLSVFSRLYHIPRRQRRQRIAQALAAMDLESAAHQMVREFSGGMVRRLEIAQAMLHRPTVLFCDEPTAGLDPAARRRVWQQMRGLIAQEGTTLLLTTHDMEEAEVLCDRVAMMRRGLLVALGTPDELTASIGPDAGLEDVFVAYAKDQGEAEGRFRDVARTRRTACRRG